MRPCLPFSLSRISNTAHSKLSCPPRVPVAAYLGTTSATTSFIRPIPVTTRPYNSMPTPDLEVKPPVTTTMARPNSGDVKVDAGEEVQMGRLAGFLESQKAEFLADLSAGKGKGWILCMGNEAGGEFCTYPYSQQQ